MIGREELYDLETEAEDRSSDLVHEYRETGEQFSVFTVALNIRIS